MYKRETSYSKIPQTPFPGSSYMLLVFVEGQRFELRSNLDMKSLIKWQWWLEHRA